MSVDWADQARKMDRTYRYARYIYNVSRKFCLLGRDALLDRIAAHPAERVLEMGCGTARNLICLARRMPRAQLFGLDVSAQMLKAASRAVVRARVSDQVTLRRGPAEDLDFARTFGLAQPFDAVFFSYSLSMMPTWPQAISAALRNLRPDGRFFVVDFWDQATLPGWFARLVQTWVAAFGVLYRTGLPEHLERLAEQDVVDLEMISHVRRYAFIAEAVYRMPVRADLRQE